MNKKNNLKAWLYLLPAILFLGVFMVYLLFLLRHPTMPPKPPACSLCRFPDYFLLIVFIISQGTTEAQL